MPASGATVLSSAALPSLTPPDLTSFSCLLLPHVTGKGTACSRHSPGSPSRVTLKIFSLSYEFGPPHYYPHRCTPTLCMNLIFRSIPSSFSLLKFLTHNKLPPSLPAFLLPISSNLPDCWSFLIFLFLFLISFMSWKDSPCSVKREVFVCAISVACS